jgi:hypothetical protein
MTRTENDRGNRRGRWARVVVAGLLAVAGSSVLIASPASALPATITATPTAGLTDQRVITVSGDGFTPDSSVVVGQCMASAVTSVNNCGSNYVYTTAGADGSYSVQLTVLRTLQAPNGTVDCAEYPGRCVAGAAESQDIVGTAEVTPLGFSKVEVSQSTGLTDGSVITVTGSGFTPGSALGVGQCLAGATTTSECNSSNAVYVTASWTGSFSVRMTLRNPIYVFGFSVPCSATYPCIVGAAESSDVAGTAARAPIEFL